MAETGQRILVVDDEPALLKMMGLYLARVGYAVTPVGATDRAWEVAENSAGGFAAAVIDATMPGMSAQDLAKRLLAASPALCVVVASGYPVDMSGLEAAAPGRVSFVQKPFTAESLVRTLRRLIGPKEEV